MLFRLKLPALLCFCTWLADPWRVRPLLQWPEVGESSTFSLSIPAEKRSSWLFSLLWCPAPGLHLTTCKGGATWPTVFAYFIVTATGTFIYKGPAAHKTSHLVKRSPLPQQKNSIRKKKGEKLRGKAREAGGPELNERLAATREG